MASFFSNTWIHGAASYFGAMYVKFNPWVDSESWIDGEPWID